MILSPMNVELTKVHYYESFRKHRNRNAHPNPKIDNKININIKRNIFGQKSWTFNVNQAHNSRQTSKNSLKFQILPIVLTICVIFALVLSSIIITVIYLKNIPKTTKHLPPPGRIIVFDHTEINVERILQNTQRRKSKQNGGAANEKLQYLTDICNCTTNEVCLRRKDGLPTCTLGKDGRDPSGCAGLCAVNLEHCRILVKTPKIYECVQNAGRKLHCPLGYFNCKDNLCLGVDTRCNGRMDCGDLSDEMDCACDLTKNFQCGNQTSCLPNWRRCDSKPDCWDNSDETNCPPLTTCPPGHVSCQSSTGCYRSTQFCDGIPDCSDQSDEICA